MNPDAGRWPTLARRIRVPLGFLVAIGYWWLARPNWWSLAAGVCIATLGICLRGAASGRVKKAAEVTTGGPYAYTRNPLYLGSIIVATGFAAAARSVWIAVALVVIFLAVYIPVIRWEESYMRSQFPNYEDYARRVPRLLPRLTPAFAPEKGNAFSRELYLKHREYNTLLGAALMIAALVIKIVWFNH